MKRNHEFAVMNAPALALQSIETAPRRTWLPEELVAAGKLDPAKWQRRGARGFTWHANGVDRRRGH
jgi:hypothetical protein